jgi:hypothetical protein
MLRLQKWREASLIHWPHRVDEVLKTKHSDTPVSYSGNNHKEARSSSRPYINCNVSSINEYDKAIDLNDRPKLFLLHPLPICRDLADDGKL